MRYFDQKHECMSADEMKKLQDERLCNTVNRVYNNVRFYHDRMDQCGLKPSDIKGVQDLHKLPFMTKADLRDNYPFGTFAVPNDQIVRIHASSGTTGKSIIVGVTKNDVKMWADCVARCLVMAGASKHDIIQVSYGYGLFTGGLGLHYGSERLERASGRADHPDFRRQHRASDSADAGFGFDHFMLHAVLFAVLGRLHPRQQYPAFVA